MYMWGRFSSITLPSSSCMWYKCRVVFYASAQWAWDTP
jgi:hypothetical protein